MKISYKQMRMELLDYLKAYNVLDVVLTLDKAELETLHSQVTKPKLMEGKHNAVLQSIN